MKLFDDSIYFDKFDLWSVWLENQLNGYTNFAFVLNKLRIIDENSKLSSTRDEEDYFYCENSYIESLCKGVLNVDYAKNTPVIKILRKLAADEFIWIKKTNKYQFIKINYEKLHSIEEMFNVENTANLKFFKVYEFAMFYEKRISKVSNSALVLSVLLGLFEYHNSISCVDLSIEYIHNALANILTDRQINYCLKNLSDYGIIEINFKRFNNIGSFTTIRYFTLNISKLQSIIDAFDTYVESLAQAKIEEISKLTSNNKTLAITTKLTSKSKKYDQVNIKSGTTSIDEIEEIKRKTASGEYETF